MKNYRREKCEEGTREPDAGLQGHPTKPVARDVFQ